MLFPNQVLSISDTRLGLPDCLDNWELSVGHLHSRLLGGVIGGGAGLTQGCWKARMMASWFSTSVDTVGWESRLAGAGGLLAGHLQLVVEK